MSWLPRCVGCDWEKTFSSYHPSQTLGTVDPRSLNRLERNSTRTNCSSNFVDVQIFAGTYSVAKNIINSFGIGSYYNLTKMLT